MSQRLVLFAKNILTLDKPQPIEDGFVLIQGNRILQVGRRKDFHLTQNLGMLDLKDTLLLPGFINAHCHLDFTNLKGRLRYSGVFQDWLRQIGAKTRKTSPAEFRKSIEKGIKESQAYGTTTLCDVSTSWESPALVRNSGLRAFVFLEVLDTAHPSPGLYWRRLQNRLKTLGAELLVTPTFRWGLAPHTPFTVSQELLRLTNRFLDYQKHLLTSIHVAESREEAALFKKGTGPLAKRVKELNPGWDLPSKTTGVQYLNEIGWLPKLDLGVHLNVVEDKDLRLLAKNRIAVVHCPGSHAYFKHLRFKYAQMRRLRIPVCLGTDSLASNQSLSLFNEMRLFKKAYPQVAGQEILSMVTVKPARALGMGNQLGRIRPSFLADLIGIPIAKVGFQRGKSLEDRVIAYKGRVSFSMVNGELRFRVAS